MMNSTCLIPSAIYSSVNTNNTSPLVAHAVTNILHVLIGLLGTVGNGLSVLGLSKIRPSTTHVIVLKYLAIADISYLFTVIFLAIINLLTHVRFYPLQIYINNGLIQILPTLFLLVSSTQIWATWMIVLVTVDRYIYVCKPHNALQIFNKTTAHVCAVLLAMAAFVFSIPRIFEVKAEKQGWFLNNRTCDDVFGLNGTALYNSKDYKLFYDVILNTTFRLMGPVIVTMGLNIRLIQSVRKSAKAVSSLTHHQRRERHFTFQMIGIVSVFIISSLVWTVACLSYLIRDDDKVRSTYLNLIGNLILTCNSSINFLFYFFIGKDFRQALCKFLRRRKCKRESFSRNTSIL
ncbi:unnamed protein product [Owenia fusiformis]|uniref:G-protein coupled receptors family 1 profile domain-containing protein n=1 Tax=Owenia fusiformis TaxID=6347 RepID=A0A8S4N1T1_OWEFU|nr:unnamed protein product [Owenia fusiformis]